MLREKMVIPILAFVLGLLLSVGFMVLPEWYRSTTMIDWIPVEWLGWVVLASFLGATACFVLILYLSFIPKKRATALDPNIRALIDSNQELVSLLRTYLESQGIIPKK